jgi:hypothetical protein
LDTLSPRITHTLTNVDLTLKLADCSICGPTQKIIEISASQVRCYAKAKKSRRMKLKYAGGNHIPTHEVTAAYTRLYEEQKGVCAKCGKTNDDGVSLAVDHCHTTGTIRGLLCRKCNVGIGLLGDNIEGLQAALDYLLRAEAS